MCNTVVVEPGLDECKLTEVVFLFHTLQEFFRGLPVYPSVIEVQLLKVVRDSSLHQIDYLRSRSLIDCVTLNGKIENLVLIVKTFQY